MYNTTKQDKPNEKKVSRKWVAKTPRLGQIMTEARNQAEIDHRRREELKRGLPIKKPSKAITKRQKDGKRSAEICRAKFSFYEVLLEKYNLEEMTTVQLLQSKVEETQRELEDLKSRISSLELANLNKHPFHIDYPHLPESPFSDMSNCSKDTQVDDIGADRSMCDSSIDDVFQEKLNMKEPVYNAQPTLEEIPNSLLYGAEFPDNSTISACVDSSLVPPFDLLQYGVPNPLSIQ